MSVHRIVVAAIRVLASRKYLPKTVLIASTKPTYGITRPRITKISPKNRTDSLNIAYLWNTMGSPLGIGNWLLLSNNVRCSLLQWCHINIVC